MLRAIGWCGYVQNDERYAIMTRVKSVENETSK